MTAPAPVSLVETAEINSTGERIRILRRTTSPNQRLATGSHDLAIMAALEQAGYMVIGIPQSFRYKHPNKPKFTRPALLDVFVIDPAGHVLQILPGTYFHKFYTVIQT